MALGRLLLFYDRNDQTGKRNEYQQELKQFFICNHIHITMNYGVIATGNQYIFIRCAERHPFRLGQGAKKDHPLKEGDNRLRVWQRPVPKGTTLILSDDRIPVKTYFRQANCSCGWLFSLWEVQILSVQRIDYG